MGTACKDGTQTGLIPQVMNSLFCKIETLKNQAEFQLHVSFIEVQEILVCYAFVALFSDNSSLNRDCASYLLFSYMPILPEILHRLCS